MNIKFGMDNYYVRYLKRFLNSEMAKSNKVLGPFDRDDQKTLISYLNLPNVKNMFDVSKELIEKFPDIENYFFTDLKDDEIQYTASNISMEISNYIKQNISDITDYCTSVGWELKEVNEWVDQNKDINNDGIVDNKDIEIVYNIANNLKRYDETITKKADINLDGIVDEQDIQILSEYVNTHRITFSIKQSNRKNYFPNKDMLVFINQFDGTFMYNTAIRDNGVGTDDSPHTNNTGNYKMAIYKCNPGQKITIAHNSANTEHLVIGSATVATQQNIVGSYLENVQEIDLKPGEGYQYEATSKENKTGYDAHFICIQCPSIYSDLTGYKTKTLTLERGDINFDGKIDMQDYMLLARYTAEGPGSEELHWNPTPKQLAVMDIPIPDGSGTGQASVDGKITTADAVELYNFITGKSSQVSLGLAKYTYTTPESLQGTGDNIDNLLIIDGHYDRQVNIPFSEFTKDDWIVHEKFFNYLLDMAIQEYSSEEDIAYLQKLLNNASYSYSNKRVQLYPGYYDENMKDIVLNYQTSKVNYTIGDLNRDNKIDNNDLILEKQIVEFMNCLLDENLNSNASNGIRAVDQKDFDLLSDYLKGSGTLTEEQLSKADINMDGVIDSKDLIILQSYLESKKIPVTSTQKNRADINQDGKVNKEDYDLLSKEVQGLTHNLKNYDITFILGWYDVQTEGLMEREFNINEDISEVSK